MITIEFSFAWLFFIIMVVGFVCMLCGIGAFKMEWIVFGVMLVFCGDGLCALGSGYYMSHPTNGYVVSSYNEKWCSEFNYSISKFDELMQCVMPTLQDNPYEKQPLHPLAWTMGAVVDFSKLTTGAVKFKVT